MISVWKTRKKSNVSHHFWFLEDAVEALKLYISEWKKREDEIEEGDPLFVKRKHNSGKRITPENIRAVMRDFNDRIGDEIDSAKRTNTDINPLSLKYLRRAFGIACDEANVKRKYKKRNKAKIK
ncbi:hypothetical protein AKJ41_01345 [candidate division MSBL1 archaeon SCGC-AAA259O05]|uniref:Tyr recombinase domain-containing protein n=1 Tax=candidate division MSBL1 archaeon SCGC-AAA259O05 TaxID=1698271 RepID=A0A133V4Y4_9EURY|nr:hypothetical protein AKJ41_01345 [candidate division MSBL1 archaeon SCGC-AAA259O05]